MTFMGEIQSIINQAKGVEELKAVAGKLEKVVSRLGEVAMHLGKIAMEGKIKEAFAHALPFLHAMGDVINGWMLLWRAVVAVPKKETENKKEKAFYEGQVKTADFFIRTVIYETLGKLDAIQETCVAALDIPDDGFGGL